MLTPETTATTVLTVLCIAMIGVSIWSWFSTRKRWDNFVALIGVFCATTALVLLFCRFILGIPILTAR